MYIRVKTTPNSPRKSIQIVESTRHGQKVKQKIVRHIGVAMDEREEEQMRHLAIGIIAKLEREKLENSPQLSFIEPPTEDEIKQSLEKKLGRPKKKKIEDILPTNQVTLADIVEKKRIVEGVHDIAGPVFDDLFSGIITGKRHEKILKDIVLSRLVQPSSKLKSQKILSEQFNIDHHIDAIYRLMDKVYPKIDTIKTCVFKKTKNLFPEGVDLLLFDVTTLYFESTNVDELRQYGYSKDHRFNTTQLVLALATNAEGLPVGYELFQGNKAEVKTLMVAIESWQKLFHISSVCFVGDRAMMSKDNVALLEKHGHKYIIAAKLRSLPKDLKNSILDEKHCRTSALGDDVSWTSEFSYQKKRLVVSYKKKRSKKDAYDRNIILEKIEKKLSANSDTKTFITNHGVKKYTTTTDSVINFDDKKILNDAQWDGLHGIITNIDIADGSAETLIARYSKLWKIEESFRINKHTLKMRPIFHWKPERIKAHIAICYMAFSVLRNLEYQISLTQKVSVEHMISELLNVQSSIYMHKKTKDLYKVPGRFTNTAKKIYRAYGLKRSIDASIYLP